MEILRKKPGRLRTPRILGDAMTFRSCIISERGKEAGIPQPGECTGRRDDPVRGRPQMVRQAPRAERHQPSCAVGRSRRGLRPLRLGEIDPHPDDQRPRADQRGEADRRREGPLGQEDRHQQAAGGDRLRLPAVQPLPPPVGPQEHHAGPDQDPQHEPEGRRGAGDDAPRSASGCPRSGTPTRPSSPAGNSSGWRSPGGWR